MKRIEVSIQKHRQYLDSLEEKNTAKKWAADNYKQIADMTNKEEQDMLWVPMDKQRGKKENDKQDRVPDDLKEHN